MQNIATKQDDISSLSAVEWNDTQQEDENAVTSSDQVLDGSNAFQLHRAMVNMAMFGQMMIDSGAADAYVLSPQAAITPSSPPDGPSNTLGPTLLKNGLQVRFVAGNTNTGASTVNVDSLGAVPIKKTGATVALAAGNIEAGKIITIDYVDAQGAFTITNIENIGGTGVTSVFGDTGPAVDILGLVNQATPGNNYAAPFEDGDNPGTFERISWSSMLTAFTGGASSEFPATTRLLFQQSTPPVGWTKEAAATYNNAGIRNTTGTVGTGGSVNYDSVHVTSRAVSVSNEASGGTITINNNTLSGDTGDTTITAAQLPLHRHMSGVASELADALAIFGYATNPGGTGGTSNNASSGNSGEATSPWTNNGNETGSTTALGGQGHDHSLAGQGNHGHTGSIAGTSHDHSGSDVNLNIKRFDTTIGEKT